MKSQLASCRMWRMEARVRLEGGRFACQGRPEIPCLPEAPWFPWGTFLQVAWPGCELPPLPAVSAPSGHPPPRTPAWLTCVTAVGEASSPLQPIAAPSLPEGRLSTREPSGRLYDFFIFEAPHHPHPWVVLAMLVALLLLPLNWLQPGR